LAIQTGQPVNINYLFEGDFNGSDEYFGRPDVVGNPFAGRHLPTTFLNASAFAVPCTWDPEAGGCVSGMQHFGNLGRNAFAGPTYKNFDLSLVKNTPIGEKLKMQFRIDFFNLYNHPNFTNRYCRVSQWTSWAVVCRTRTAAASAPFPSPRHPMSEPAIHSWGAGDHEIFSWRSNSRSDSGARPFAPRGLIQRNLNDAADLSVFLDGFLTDLHPFRIGCEHVPGLLALS